jgi:hypothetical protein
MGIGFDIAKQYAKNMKADPIGSQMLKQASDESVDESGGDFEAAKDSGKGHYCGLTLSESKDAFKAKREEIIEIQNKAMTEKLTRDERNAKLDKIRTLEDEQAKLFRDIQELEKGDDMVDVKDDTEDCGDVVLADDSETETETESSSDQAPAADGNYDTGAPLPEGVKEASQISILVEASAILDGYRLGSISEDLLKVAVALSKKVKAKKKGKFPFWLKKKDKKSEEDDSSDSSDSSDSKKKTKKAEADFAMDMIVIAKATKDKKELAKIKKEKEAAEKEKAKIKADKLKAAEKAKAEKEKEKAAKEKAKK